MNEFLPLSAKNRIYELALSADRLSTSELAARIENVYGEGILAGMKLIQTVREEHEAIVKERL